LRKILAILLLTAGTAEAQARVYADRTLSWTCPTTREDASPFSCATDAAGYDLEVTPSGGVATIVELAATATSKIVTADAAGTSYRIRICDLAGACSVWSNSVKKPTRPTKVTMSIN
jgi:hypothetical protein